MSSRLKTRLRKYKPLLSAYEWFWVKLQNSNKLNTHFYNLTDSFSLCNNWAYKIPNEFDVIIGVPRAGLMFANILACRLGRPLSTPDNFLRGEIWFSHDAIPPEKIKKVLLVEDSVGFGNQITNAYQKLKEAFPDLQIEKACLFASPKGIDKVDYAFSKELPPYLFEWNILTATWGWGEVVSDLDGVLCFDCPIDWDDGQKKYHEFIRNTKPLFIPNYPLSAIVTARPESVRDLTEEWLNRYNVKYKTLIMRPDNIERTFENIVKMKSDATNYLKPLWFWESDIAEAKAIHLRTKRPVLCMQTMSLIV